MIFKKILYKIKEVLYYKKLRRRIPNQDVCIISHDCTAGYIYHQMGKKFMSPFINVLIKEDSYFLLINNFKEFMNSELFELNDSGKKYPVGFLLHDDKKVFISFIHSKSFEKCKNDWDRRKKRLDYDNLVFIYNLTNVDSDDEIARLAFKFNTANISNKIIFHKSKKLFLENAFVFDFGSSTFQNALLFRGPKYEFKKYLDQFDYSQLFYFNKINGGILQNNVTMLYLTCDQYSFLWDGFFKLFKKYFSSFKSQVVATCYNQDLYKSYFNCIDKKRTNDTSWGTRLLQALDSVKTDYVFLNLDDYFIFNSCHDFEKLFNAAIMTMETNKNIGCIELKIYSDFHGKKYNIQFDIEPKFSGCYLSLQPSIWRKDFLKKVVRKGEDPWMFEIFGSYRASHYRELVLCSNNYYNTLYPLDFGGVIWKGKIHEQYQPKLDREEIRLVVPKDLVLEDSYKFKSQNKLLQFYRRHYCRFSTYIRFIGYK